MAAFDNTKDISSLPDDYFTKLQAVGKKAASEKKYTQEYYTKVRQAMSVVGKKNSNGKMNYLSKELEGVIKKEFTGVSLDLPFESWKFTDDKKNTIAKMDKIASEISGKLKRIGLEQLGYTIRFNKAHSVFGLFRDKTCLIQSTYADYDPYGACVGQEIIDDIKKVLDEMFKKSLGPDPFGNLKDHKDINTSVKRTIDPSIRNPLDHLHSASGTRGFNRALKDLCLDNLRIRRSKDSAKYELQRAKNGNDFSTYDVIYEAQPWHIAEYVANHIHELDRM